MSLPRKRNEKAMKVKNYFESIRSSIEQPTDYDEKNDK